MKLNQHQIAAVTINDAANYVLIGTYKGMGGDLFVEGKVGNGGAIAALKVTASPVDTGPTPANHVSLVKQNADFAAADQVTPHIGGTSMPATPIYQTKANEAFWFKLRYPAVEISFWAKKAAADTTVLLNITEKIESPAL
jgi:hypothetical protein